MPWITGRKRHNNDDDNSQAGDVDHIDIDYSREESTIIAIKHYKTDAVLSSADLMIQGV